MQPEHANVIKVGQVQVIVVFSQQKHVQITVTITENVIKLMDLANVIGDLLELIVNHVKILPINVHIIKLKLIFAQTQVTPNMLLNVNYSVNLELVELLNLLVLL